MTLIYYSLIVHIILLISLSEGRPAKEECKLPINYHFNQMQISNDKNTHKIFAKATKSLTLCCCSGNNIKVKWFVNGKETEKKIKKCGKHCHKFYIGYVTTHDDGLYQCRYTDNSSIQHQISAQLKVLRDEPRCGPPESLKVLPEETKLAIHDEDVTWNCSAFVGEMWNGANYSLQFQKQNSEGKYIDVENDDERFIVRVKFEDIGIVKGNFTIKGVQRSDYGNYSCLVTNWGQPSREEFKLKHGVPKHVQIVGILRIVLLLIMCHLFVGIFFLTLWRRYRSILVLLLKQKKMSSMNDDLCNIIIIHGEDSESWVMTQLCPVLEKVAKYRCFLPPRDMIPGMPKTTQVVNYISKCSTKIIVTSPELLKCDWVACALHSTMAQKLSEGTVSPIIIAFQNVSSVICYNEEDVNLVKLLCTLPVLKVPILEKDFKEKNEKNLEIVINKCLAPIFSDVPIVVVGNKFQKGDANYIEEVKFLKEKELSKPHSNLNIGYVNENENNGLNSMKSQEYCQQTRKYGILNLFVLRCQFILSRDAELQFWNKFFLELTRNLE